MTFEKWWKREVRARRQPDDYAYMQVAKAGLDAATKRLCFAGYVDTGYSASPADVGSICKVGGENIAFRCTHFGSRLMTAEREAMTLEQVRDLLRDSRTLNFYTLHHGMAFFNSLADAIDAHLSRAAEPVYQTTESVDVDSNRNWFDVAKELYEVTRKEDRRILYTHPSEDARDVKRLDWLVLHLPGSVVRSLVGVLSDTGDVNECREKIDAAMKGEGNE